MSHKITKNQTNMKNKKITKSVLIIMGSIITAGTMQAQQTKSQRDSLLTLQRNAVSLITAGQGSAKPNTSGFWGYAFGDYAYMGKGDSAGRGTKQQYKGLGQYGTGQNLHPNAFEIRRAYLGYDYIINSHFSANALLAYEGDQDVNNDRTVYLKYMYFKWKNIWKNTDLKVGQQATNSFATAYNTEPLLGYRSIEKTLLDMHGMDGSSDMGIMLEGRIWTHKAKDTTKVPLFIGYSAMVGDNSGNNPVAAFTATIENSSLGGQTVKTTTTTSVVAISPKTGKDTTLTGTSTSTTAITVNNVNNTTDEAKKFRGNLYVNALNNALTVGVYGDFINYGDYYYGTATGYQHAVMTDKVYAAYNSKWFGLGFEYDMQTYKNGEVESYATTTNTATKVKTVGAKNDTTNAEQSGISIFAHGTIIQSTLNIFVRYDMYTPDTKYGYTAVASGNTSSLANGATEGFTSAMSNVSNSINGNYWKETFINAGLDWTPTFKKPFGLKDKRVHIMPNVWYYGIKSSGYGSNALLSSNYMLYRISFLYTIY